MKRGEHKVLPAKEDRMVFEVHEVAKQVVRELKGVVRRVHLSDPELSKQMREAAQGIVLQIGEGSRRSGRDRLMRYGYAAGSAEETRDAIHISLGWGYVREQ